MNANAFRHLYNYHFSENRKVWEVASQLSYEEFTREVGYSHGSVRNQLVHLMNVDEVWFSELRGVESSESYQPADFDDRAALRARWDGVEQKMRDDLAALRDDMLFTQPIKEPQEDRDLYVWQALLHVINHGTDHRAQVLRTLHDLGVPTTSQDYIFYAYENPL